MMWLLVAVAPLAMILVLWWFGWLRRNRPPPRPRTPFRQWRD